MDDLIIFLIFVIPIVLPVALFIIAVIKERINYRRERLEYENSKYYEITKYPFKVVYNDSGKYGEYCLYTWLEPFESIGCKFLFNLYIPRDDGRTSEVDMIMFHNKGLFVIECKNYSGWIFGNENNKQWTQTLPAGRWGCHKERFYNPIMQNRTHIKSIRKFIDDTIPIYSIVAFSDKCELMDVIVKGKTIVTYYSKIQEEIETRLSKIDSYTMTPQLMSQTYEKLLQYTKTDDDIKLVHIKNIEESKTSM